MDLIYHRLTIRGDPRITNIISSSLRQLALLTYVCGQSGPQPHLWLPSLAFDQPTEPGKNRYHDITYPGSRQRRWLRELNSAVPLRVSPLIIHTQTESGAYLLRDSSPSFAVSATISLQSHLASLFSQPLNIRKSRNCVPITETPPAQVQTFPTAGLPTEASDSSNPRARYMISVYTHCCTSIQRTRVDTKYQYFQHSL